MADQDSRAGKRYATPAILEWVDGLHAVEDGALQRASSAPARHGFPQIQVSRTEGRWLEVALRMVQARRVVEVTAAIESGR